MALGEPDPFDMLRQMPAVVFDHWMAFNELSPIGTWRLDVLSSRQIAAMFEVRRNHEKRDEPFNAMDFMPVWNPEEPEEESVEEQRKRMEAKVIALNALFGGLDLRSNGREEKPAHD